MLYYKDLSMQETAAKQPFKPFSGEVCCQRGLTEAIATIICSRALSLCKMENLSWSHVRYKRRQALVSFFHGRAFFYIGYLLCGHFLNVSDHIKRLLFLFIKQWLRSSRKQPPYFSTLLTPTPSLSHAPSSHQPSFCTAWSCSCWRQCEMTQLKVPSHS